MDLAYTLAGNAPIIHKFQVQATVSKVGTPIIPPGSAESGVKQGTTTAASLLLGMNLDTVTYVTAQQSDNSDTERLINVVISPDAVWNGKLSGGATEDTALGLQTDTVASAGGTVVTTGAAWNSPTYLNGVVWGFDGANASKARRLTTVGATSGTVTVAFPIAIAVGDNFLRAPFWPGASITAQFTTNLYEVDATIAVGTGARFRCVELILNDQTLDGRTNSYVRLLSNDHAFNQIGGT